MLSAPGLRFHRILTPFFQLVVGPALPAVGRVLEYTLFVLWFSCSCVYLFLLLFYFILCLL